jgi:hypothetical protein
LAIEWVLQTLFTGDIRREFDQRLMERVQMGPGKEMAELNAKLKDLDALLDRIQTFMLNPNVNPRIWEPKLEVASQDKEATAYRLSQLKQSSRQLTPAVLDIQVATDPLPVLRELLQGKEEAYKVRATLRRLLSRFELVRKPSRYVSVFQFALQPGVCLAEVSDTTVIDSSQFEFEVTASTSAHRPVVWTVSGRRI